MSKQSKAKENQGYSQGGMKCSNCSMFSSEIVQKETSYGTREQEKNLRCAVGGFAIKKNACCTLWDEVV